MKYPRTLGLSHWFWALVKDVTQRNFTQPRGWIGTISYTIFLPEKTLANFYFEDEGSLKLCSSNCCAVWTLQQSPKAPELTMDISGLESLICTICNAGAAGTCSFLNPHQKGISSEQECWHVPTAMHETALFFLCRQPTESPSAFVTIKIVLYIRERIAFVLFPRQYQLQ